MKFKNKILYLQNSVNLTDFHFCRRYKINFFAFKKWKQDKKELPDDTFKFLIESFDLDYEDFSLDTSTLETPKKGEHYWKGKRTNLNNDSLYEGFEKEDNMRYEERD